MTVGYGDIVPVSLGEKAVAMLVILLGVSLFAYFIGSMSRVIATVDSRQATISKKRAAVDEFLTLRHFPK